MAALAAVAALVLTGMIAPPADAEDLGTIEAAETPEAVESTELAEPVATADPADAAADPADAAADPAEAPVAAEPAAAEPVPAADATGSATGLTLRITADGTANSDGSWDSSDAPGYDSSPNNGIVRTHDYVTYAWGYSVATAGDVTLVQTLPEGMAWVAAESTAACAQGTDALSADRRTLTCIRADQSTGAGTLSVKAEVPYAGNGQVLSSVLSSPGAVDSAAASVTASAAPQFDLQVNAGSNGYQAYNGVDGFSFYYQIRLYQKIDPVRGIRGSEALADGATWTLDPSEAGPNVVLTNCATGNAQNVGGAQIYEKITGTTQNASNSVVDRGQWSCSQDVVGGPITLTLNGAITDLRSYPTHYSNGSAYSSTVALASGTEFFTWFPASDYPETRRIDMQLSDFDPVSITGQSNFGTGYADGQEPGAARINYVNTAGFTIQLTEGLAPRFSLVWDPTGAPFNMLNPIAAGASSTSAGDTPLAPGDSGRFGGYYTNQSSSGKVSTNTNACVVWDESLLNIGSSPDFYSQRGVVAVEYAHIDGLGSDAARRAYDCGTVADGAAAWSTTVAGAGGAEQVNAMRVYYPNMTAGTSNYTGLVLTRTDTELPAKTALPVFWQLRSDQSALVKSTFDPQTQINTTLGARALSIATTLQADISWDVSSTAPGVARTVTVQPSLSHPSATAEDVSVTVTIPTGVSVVEDSWPADAEPVMTVNADGSTTLTFALGDLTGEPDALTFDVNISTRLAMPAAVTATAVIASISDFRPETYRTDTATIGVNAARVFSVSKAGSTATAVPGVPVTYTVGWLNGLEASVGTGAIVDVLPFDGDDRGTENLSGVTLTGLSVDADMAVRVQYTTTDPATALAAVRADPSGESVGGWADWPADGSTPAGVTAVRFLTGSIEEGMGGEVTMTVVPGALGLDDSMVNDIYGEVADLGADITAVSPVVMASGGVRLSGTVYADDDYSWTLDDGESGIADVLVSATGYGFGANGVDDGGAGDDVQVTAAGAYTATSDADGAYQLDGLPPGRWTLTVDTLPTGRTTGETPDAEVLLQTTETAAGLDFGFVEQIDAPVAGADQVRVSAGDTVTIPVLANDTMDASGAIVAVGTPTPEAGTVTWTAGDTTVRYTAPADASGQVAFEYTVQDKARQAATAAVTVEIVPLPTAAPGHAKIAQTATPLPSISELFTGDAAAISALSDPANGTVELVDGVVVYTPDAGFSGTDQFGYTVTDSIGKSAGAVFTLTVVAAPVADGLSVATRQDTVVNADLGALATGDALTLAITAPGLNGEAIVNGGVVTYTPAAGFIGTDTVTLTWTDSVGQTAHVVLDIEVRQTPVANDDTAVTAHDVPVAVDVLVNDAGVGLTLTGVDQPASGSAEVVDGQVVYTPAEGFAGTDVLTYRAEDRWAGEISATVTITVYADPIAPDVTGRTGVGMAIVLDPSGVVVEPTDDLPRTPWTVTGVEAPSELGVAELTDAGTVIFTPAEDVSGEVSFPYTVTDEFGLTATGTITVTVLTLAVEDVDTRTAYQTEVSVDVLDNATGESVVLSGVGRPSTGSARIDADGRATYLPADGFSGLDAFGVMVADEVGQTADATVRVTVGEPDPVPPTEKNEDPGPKESEVLGERFLAVTGVRLGDTVAAGLIVIVLGFWVLTLARRREPADD